MGSYYKEIRVLTVDDAVQFRGLRLRALREEPEAFGSSWEQENKRPLEATITRLQDSNTVVLGSFDNDGRMVGMVRLLREDSIKMCHKAGIFGMYVAPEARGHGLGRTLLQAAIAHAHATPGIEQLSLAVVATNTAACSLYHALGFRPYGHETAAIKLGDRYLDKELMVLFLGHT